MLIATVSAQNISDAAISAAVSDELVDDSAVGATAIDVTTINGIVTLSGTVDNLLARDRAIELAETIRGVRAVVDKIAVDTPTRSDRALREDVSNALLYNRATESFEVSIMADDQHVTLNGTVDSWQEKDLAGRVARGVHGVKSVDNQLQVDYETQRPDAEIAPEIREALRWNALVDDALIDVSVDDGQVTLAGTVGSAAEKRLATYDAWVAGVTSVNADSLEVARWARDEDLRTDKYVSRTNDQIVAAVQSAMLYDPSVNTYDISVSADNGVVTLRGTVDTVHARRAAARNAGNTVGVWRVKNRISVRAEGMTDAQIERNIQNALIRNPIVNRHELVVDVVGGQAYLSGTVDTFFEKREADDIAGQTYGVTAVNNNIAVDRTFGGGIYDPYVGTSDLFDYEWYQYPTSITTLRTDWEILEDINDELWWSPFVDSDEVNVTVDNGVATLTGTVDTWAERRAATENAYEGGAIAVINDLRVEYGPDYYLP